MKMKVKDSLYGAVQIVDRHITELNNEIEQPGNQWKVELWTALAKLHAVKDSLIWSETLCEHEEYRNYQSLQHGGQDGDL